MSDELKFGEIGAPDRKVCSICHEKFEYGNLSSDDLLEVMWQGKSHLVHSKCLDVVLVRNELSK